MSLDYVRIGMLPIYWLLENLSICVLLPCSRLLVHCWFGKTAKNQKHNRGLSGNTAQDIQKVDPAFIQTAGIAQSLTPGRNNGFLNMLAMMKKKALEVSSSSGSSSQPQTTTSADAAGEASDRPMYDAIVSSLQALQPTVLQLHDNSHEHAGHAGNKGNGQESHFQLYVVADAFDGLNLVKRHKLIYMLLGDVMPRIHALQIQALTPQEAAASNDKN